ncbi:MAG: hypothetical protein JO227_11810, partial [Acetobacteraceae bacterium]|nr:hypothetical protein [Acetobacteraceae bacterium]
MTRDIARPVYQIPRHRQRHVSPVAHAPASAEAARRGIDCPSCQAIAPPMARFCPQCGIDLRGLVIPMHHEDPATPPARAGQWLAERRQLTVVFCDLIGSSELATRVDPEDFAELIGRYHRCISETMGRYGGFFARPMGDGALVFFGFPVAHEDDAERAVRASLLTVEAIAATAASGGPRLHVRIGIASGIAIVGDVADTAAAHRLDAAGEVVNLAARLQQIAEPNSVVIAENVRRLLGKLFVYRDLGECLLKGWDAPIAVAQVVRPAANPSRFRARSSRPVTPLVGRREAM